MDFEIGFNSPRVLDFDIEARPLGWYAGDWVHKEVTVIAFGWCDDPDTVRAVFLTRAKGSAKRMLQTFKKAYDEADVVAGHYIRGFDLSTLNAMYAEHELPGLGAKLTHDTKGDLKNLQGISKSQENLAAWLGIPSPKVGMNMEDWRKANRLTPEGISLAVDRAIGDVKQNIEMRAELIRRGLLGEPKWWYPGGSEGPKYTP